MTRPRPDLAMRQLIEEIRRTIPLDTPLSRLCAGPCSGCPKKLLEYLDRELAEWEARLHQGEVPRLGDLQRLARSSRKIQTVLVRNGLLAASD